MLSKIALMAAPAGIAASLLWISFPEDAVALAARFLPVIGMALFFGIGFVWRAWLQYRRHGSAGIILFRSPHWGGCLRDILFLALLAVLSAEAALVAVAPESVAGLLLPALRQTRLGVVVGSVLLFGGLALMVVAQLHLGASWRVGIEDDARPGLVTEGLYRVSRNPIFLGMFFILFGLALLLPTWISVGTLLVAIGGVYLQVREEERYLLRVYGDAYRAYAARVGRFLPWDGKL